MKCNKCGAINEPGCHFVLETEEDAKWANLEVGQTAYFCYLDCYPPSCKEMYQKEEEKVPTISKLWKDKYKVSWCGLCEVASIVCPVCKATSCNGSSCSVCHEDFNEFHALVNCCAEDYCSEQEINAYNKVRRIQSLIVSSIQMGDNKINWEHMEEQGRICENDREIFNLKQNNDVVCPYCNSDNDAVRETFFVINCKGCRDRM